MSKKDNDKSNSSEEGASFAKTVEASLSTDFSPSVIIPYDRAVRVHDYYEGYVTAQNKNIALIAENIAKSTIGYKKPNKSFRELINGA